MFDVIVAFSLLFLLLPLLLIVATLVRVTSRGPVLFKQSRTGADGVPFLVFKFRSMYAASCQERTVQQATRTDPRITPLGRFIRRTSIDELPQLLNVLQGHMSLIGPRPHAMAHDAYYAAQIPHYTKRFAARPGLSGLAQVRGSRGETPLTSDMERRISFDLDYIRTASFALDCRLMLATARETIFSSAAY